LKVREEERRKRMMMGRTRHEKEIPQKERECLPPMKFKGNWK
jgi:hypothetical protein